MVHVTAHATCANICEGKKQTSYANTLQNNQWHIHHALSGPSHLPAAIYVSLTECSGVDMYQSNIQMEMCAPYQIIFLAIIKRNGLCHADDHEIQHILGHWGVKNCSVNFEQYISPTLSHLRPSHQKTRFSKPEQLTKIIANRRLPIHLLLFYQCNTRIRDNI